MHITATSVWLGLTIFLAIIVSTGEYHELQFFFDRSLIVEEKQYWRVFTSILYEGQFSVRFVLYMYLEYHMLLSIEQNCFHDHSLEYVLFLIASGSMIIFLRFHEVLHDVFLSSYMRNVVCYIGSKGLPNFVLGLGGFPIQYRYVPAVLLILSLAFRGVENFKAELISLLVGHLLWYLREVFPLITGWSPLRLPH